MNLYESVKKELTESYDMGNVVDDMLTDIKSLLETVKSQKDPQIMVSSIVTALEGIIKRAEENINEAW